VLRQSSIGSTSSGAAAWAYAAGLSLMLETPNRGLQGDDSVLGPWESDYEVLEPLDCDSDIATSDLLNESVSSEHVVSMNASLE